MGAVITAQVAQEALDLIRRHGGIKQASRNEGVPYTTLHRRYERAVHLGLDGQGELDLSELGPTVRGRIHATPRQEWGLPKPGKISRYIFTCAQNNTHLHQGTWGNLQALAKHYGARICVATFTYDKASYGKKSVKKGKAPTAEDASDLWYAPEIEPYVVDESVSVAPGLIWCGEMNMLPTAVTPLSGFESYTGRKSGIFPHTKLAMESIASGKHEGTKFNYTTGTITQRNYIAKKAGLKAEFHHSYGALLVEVDSDGNWFCRQLNADSEGTLYDLDLRAANGKVTRGHRVEGITWGDIHVGTIPPDVLEMQWGKGGMMDILKPRFQFLHDVLDFRSRNHHDRSNCHKQFEKFIEGRDDVVAELKEVAAFISDSSYRRWCQTVVVDSNHDNAMMRWLREADYKTDPPNAIFYLTAQLEVYKAKQDRNSGFHLVEWTMHQLGDVLYSVRFLRPDESFILCSDANGGIECGLHGDYGPNGARGSVRGFAKMGRKSNTGHGHAAEIRDGAYRGGITGGLDQGYNVGPSNWSRSHIVTYPNGKRAVYTCWGPKWRA